MSGGFWNTGCGGMLLFFLIVCAIVGMLDLLGYRGI